jgi:hypothetical protein
MKNQNQNAPARRVLRRPALTTPSPRGSRAAAPKRLRRWSVAELILQASLGLPATAGPRNA